MATYSIGADPTNFYFGGSATSLIWDGATESGATAEIFFDSSALTFVQVDAAIDITGGSATVGWTVAATGTMTATVQFLDSSFALIDSQSASVGTGATSVTVTITPVSLPAGSLVRVRLTNGSSNRSDAGGSGISLEWSTGAVTGGSRWGSVGWPS